MTTPGPVADPPSVPTKAVAARYGAPKDKGDAEGSANDGGQGFGDVMSKLEQDAVPDAKASARALARATTNIRPPSVESDRVVEVPADHEGAVDVSLDFKIDLGAVVNADDAAVEEQADTGAVPATANANMPNPAMKDLAALVVLMPANAQDGNFRADNAKVLTPNSDPGAATRALVDAMSVATGEKAPDAPERQPTDGEDGKQLAAPNASVGTSEPTPVFPKDSLSTVLASADMAPHASPDKAPDLRPVEKARSSSTKATVLQQEAHFAPVVRETQDPRSGAFSGDGSTQGGETAKPNAVAATSVDVAPPTNQAAFTAAVSPAAQIADHIASATSGAVLPDRLSTTQDVPIGKSPFKVLSIQLQPADLGTVTVRMELKDGELTLHVEADRADTADLIRSDQDTLSNLLRVSGYSVDAGSIKVMEGDRSLVTPAAGQQGAQTNLQSSSQGQSGSSERQGQAHRGGHSPGGGQSGGAPSRNEGDETGTNRTGRGLFI